MASRIELSAQLMVLICLAATPSSLLAEPKMVSAGGFQLEFELSGEGGDVLLLESGGGGGLEPWDPIFEELSQSASVLRYSRVATGNSEKTAQHFSVEDYAGHLKALLDELTIERVILVAHSYGGNVARTFAANHPQMVVGLLLIDPASEHDVDIMRSIDLDRANREIEKVKLADIAHGKSNHITDFWAKFPLPDYPQIPDIPVTVIASIKEYEEPANLFFTKEGRQKWGQLWKDWAESFPRGRIVLTDKSYHDVQFQEPNLVVDQVRKLLVRVREQK